MRLFLSLNQPNHIRILHDAKGWANVGAKSDLDRTRDALVELREAAETARVLVRTATLPEPPDLIVAQAKNVAATRAARTARSEAEAATIARLAHTDGTPTGWRRLMGWANGATARHRAIGTRLAGAEAQRACAAEEAEGQAHQAAKVLGRATERHQAAIKACREGYQAEADAAPARIAAVEAALDLLYQRPELARMGPTGLLRAGYVITDARNRASLDPEADATVTHGWTQ